MLPILRAAGLKRALGYRYLQDAAGAGGGDEGAFRGRAREKRSRRITGAISYALVFKPPVGSGTAIGTSKKGVC